MSDLTIEYTLSAIAGFIDGEVLGDDDHPIRGVATLEKAGPFDLSFLASKKYLSVLEKSRAGAIVCPEGIRIPHRNLILVKNPHLSFGRIVGLFHPSQEPEIAGIHPTAILGAGIRLGKGVAIGPYAVVGKGVVISDSASVGPLSWIGDRAEIGEGTRIGPRVSVYPDVRLGKRCVVQAGTVLGSDGFGYAEDDEGRHRKIPQVGRLVIEDDVEIGSNCAIDRGSLGDTIIGRGTKFDNLVHIAHNVTIGDDSLLVAQVGISGSTVIGKRVVLAGQAGVAGHIEIGNGAVVGAQAGVVKSVPPGEIVSGYPARPHRKALKTQALLVKIPELVERVKELENRVKAMRRNQTNVKPVKAGEPLDEPDDR